MDKSYRIHSNISKDILLNVDMGQDFDFLEVLTLRLSQNDAYKLHSSNYGVIIGRVLANDAFGIPNAKISVFVERDNNVSSEIESLYPYVDTSTTDREGRKYNLLPDYSDDECYRVVGTFPNKRLVLDDNLVLEVYDKYYRYTTVTNECGDYMLFGVPSGNQKIHVDLDLSDIGILSQKPRDFEYKGYNVTMFDNPNQFKESTNLNSLAQIFSQDKGVFVYPFWGDAENGVACITRSDVQIQYKFEPTCVFMGSIVSDNDSNSIGHKCAPSVRNGMNNQLIASEGTIEMIRKTTEGLVEEFQIQGNQLINSDGVWCYQIPMNLDYIGMDEYGNIVPTDNPSKGIPTRAQVRFRISKNETTDEGFSRHTAKYLVPMNPMFSESSEIPTIDYDGSEVEKMYQFGSSTPQSCFRDLYWNNVYSVKNYIPKVQVAHRAYSSNYGALKGANLVDNQNPIPFNKLRIDIPFPYMIVCILFTIVMKIIGVVNGIIRIICSIIRVKIPLGFTSIRPFAWIGCPSCLSLNAGMDEGNISYYPGCGCPSSDACKQTSCPDEMGGSCKKVSDDIALEDKIQQNLAAEYNIVKLDLYQDWINGVLYMPLWYWRKRKKKTFLFGLFSSRAKSEFCDCDKTYNRLKAYVTCNVEYNDNSFGLEDKDIPEKEDRWHKDRSGRVGFRHGLIKGVTNKDDLTVYYYAAVQATDENDSPNLAMADRKKNFKAIRLYATDIILLGNLNENNLYGIPQFFTTLPSSTSNVPPVAAVEEEVNEETNDPTNALESSSDDRGNAITTGMDWGARGNRDKPTYKKGLFMDLSCTYATTRAKSCFNVERLSELGVNLDMTYDMSYSNGANHIEKGLIDSDGFVTKLELDDSTNRAMFATMNHVGFIPQAYQDEIDGYTTQVADDATSYLIPKFKYIYPVDFDGRMQIPMNRYKKGFNQAMYDELDESYVTFRLGANKNGDSGRKRHFYHVKGSNHSMPLYNNSFYFYFGINKGKTAIEKFNEMFYSQCFKNTKIPFTLDITTRGASYCDCIYADEKDAYAYIHINVDDIQTPFSYRVLDANGNEVVAEENMIITDFVVGGTINDEKVIIPNENGIVLRQIDGEAVDNRYGKSGLTNQIYSIEVIDGNFKKLKDRAMVNPKGIGLYYTAYNLGTKFYDKTTSPMDYICDNGLNGRIEISGFSIDGHDFSIASMSSVIDTGDTASSYSTTSEYIRLIGEEVIGDGSSPMFKPNCAVVDVKIELLDTSYSLDCSRDNCAVCCQEHIHFDTERKIVTYKVYRPSKYSLTTIQVGACCNGSSGSTCSDGKQTDNVSNESVNIANGEPFEVFINDVPMRFLIGNGSKFYSDRAVTSATDASLCGWYGLHQEESYLFNIPQNMPVNRNQELWSEYIPIESSMDSIGTKQSVIKFKLQTMFDMAKGAYATTNNYMMFTYSSRGGTQPILYRKVTPFYDSDVDFLTKYLYADSNSTTLNVPYPNIVTSNYASKTIMDNLPRFNEKYKNSEYIGNYFAAFTNNGNQPYISEPMKAALMVTPDKQIGEDEVGDLSVFIEAYDPVDTEKKSYFRGMFVDRRLDYDIDVFCPMVGHTFKLDDSDTMSWKYSRLRGKIINGIEMSYDEKRNIVSANTVPDPNTYETIGANPNKSLEYSYEYSQDGVDVKTIYNDKPDQIKRFYSVQFNGKNVKDYVWSSSSKDKVYDAVSALNADTGATIESFTYHIDKEFDEYNGDFNVDNVISSVGYPMVRYIDIIDKTADKTFLFAVTSCTYDMTVDMEDGVISALANEGESFEIELEFDNMIEFRSVNQDDDDFSNVTFQLIGSYQDPSTQKFAFSAATISLSYVPRTVSNYRIYTSTPYLIKVFPYIEYDGDKGIDGVTYLQRSGENGLDLFDRLDKIKIYDFNNKRDRTFPSGVSMKGIKKNNGGGMEHKVVSVPTSDNDYSNVMFRNNTVLNAEGGKKAFSDVDVFTVAYINEYLPSSSSTLTNNIRTIEYSDFYDLRSIKLRVIDGRDCRCSWLNDEKIWRLKVGEDEAGNPIYRISEFVNLEDADGETEKFQVLLFEIDVEESENKMFENLGDLSYRFKFFYKRKSKYFAQPSEIYYDYDGDVLKHIWLYVEWNEEWSSDGIVKGPDESGWNRNALYIKLKSGFTYKLGHFRLFKDDRDNPNCPRPPEKEVEFKYGMKFY